MAKSDKKLNIVSRRGFIGIGLLLPFLSVAKTPRPAANAVTQDVDDDEYTTMLTSAGGVVRVKKSALKESKIINKNMSNKSLLGWLKLRDKE